MKRKEAKIEYPLYNPDKSSVIDVSTEIPEADKKALRDQGLRLISEGKLAVMINFSGSKSDLRLQEARPTIRPNWPLDMSLLEFYLHKLKGLSRLAIKSFGKNYEKQREAILVFL